jgi:UDP-N-acetylmuramoyl-tripeptide--D-alanyl-D-alanine ligase
VISRGEDLLVPENVQGNYHVVTSGENPADDFVVSGIIDNGADGMEFDLQNMWMKQHFVIPAAGRHNVFNAAVAAAAAAQLNITPAEAARGMEKAKITEGRLAFKHSDKLGIDIIDDTYNASPESMKAATDLLMSLPGERKIAVLGDMYELGENSRRLHLEVGAYTDEKNVDLVLGVGPMGCVMADASGARGIAYESKEELKKDLKNYLGEGDTVLVKASRGMALDEIVDFLME